MLSAKKKEQPDQKHIMKEDPKNYIKNWGNVINEKFQNLTKILILPLSTKYTQLIIMLLIKKQ